MPTGIIQTKYGEVNMPKEKDVSKMRVEEEIVYGKEWPGKSGQ